MMTVVFSAGASVRLFTAGWNVLPSLVDAGQSHEFILALDCPFTHLLCFVCLFVFFQNQLMLDSGADATGFHIAGADVRGRRDAGQDGALRQRLARGRLPDRSAHFSSAQEEAGDFICKFHEKMADSIDSSCCCCCCWCCCRRDRDAGRVTHRRPLRRWSRAG